jgi:predicted ArsR family transcriptional regulator
VENHEAFAALASHARYQILDALSAHPKTIRELTKELGVHRLTLRYHLGFLLSEGFVEEVPATHQGKAGRPPAYYRTARHAMIPGFPPRRFEFIAQASLSALLEALGEGDARQRLYTKGKTVGAGVVRGIAAQKGVSMWTPALFDEHILKGSYREMGVSTEVLAATPSSIEYRAYGCPFLELAEQMPDVVCDALDAGFHDGIDEAVGGASTVRRRCLGHGDLFCEYTVTWGSNHPQPAAGARPITAGPKETPP